MATVGPASLRCTVEVPAERLAAVIGSWRAPALLESGPGFGASGRWSILAAEPRLVFEATGSSWRVRSRGERRSGSGDVLGTLRRLLETYRLADPREIPDPALPPFQGGMIGYFGYDLAPLLERLPRRAARDSGLPDVRFALYDTAVIVDHATGAAELWAHDLVGEGAAATARRFRRWRTRLGAGVPIRARPPEAVAGLGPIASNFERPAYLDAVRKALAYIAAGDVFQVNLAQRFQARGQAEPLALYLRLKERSPAPFAGFLRWGRFAVVSASPEWFYQTRGDRIVTRPIKGTRPRSHDPHHDARLAAELAASPKDRAELTMIVDLERNDLGRVCRYGTVRVVDPLTIESFAQVHHLVATVEGQLRPEAGPIAVVRALFPGGSITGAPKIRAMEIIDELEPDRRGMYTGALGYFSRGGTSGFNIAIRTIVVEGDRVGYHVGGGIVADSDPDAEYEETLHKGVGLRQALDATGAGP